ncbi:hypothetical protein N7470_008272 [Penicillium chermesinum]|nr:hypothetical protein N7470_008272 [Penicillium chermesinum]
MSAAGVTVSGTSDTSIAPAPSQSGTQPFVADSEESAGPASNGKENVKAQGTGAGSAPNAKPLASAAEPELDDFGLPIRPRSQPQRPSVECADENDDHAPANIDTRGGTDGSNVHEQSQETRSIQATETEAPETKPKSETGHGEPAEPKSTPEPKHETQGPQTEDSRKGQEEYSTETTRPASKSLGYQIPEWSHMHFAKHDRPQENEEEEEEEDEWKDMPALGEMDYYDDYGRLVARGSREEDDEAVYSGLGGAGKGYTRVQLDEDAQSANSLDEDTSYLFKEGGHNSAGLVGEELRDTVSQLQATKDLLNETQKIAYVGVVRLAVFAMNTEISEMRITKATKKTTFKAQDSMRKWGQAMMGRLYAHMDINPAEQVMIEQLAEHGVQPEDLIRPLMQNARVKNPMADQSAGMSSPSVSSPTSPTSKFDPQSRASTETAESEFDAPPPYEEHEDEDAVPEVHTPSQMPKSDQIDIDLRWTVLCDLFLVLIADSAYDARSRSLLERVGAAMDVTWLQISRFEKRVTDAIEMQEQTEKENWDESEHMEKRRQMSRKTKYMVMGLATVGGGLVIGLSAGLLAPVIGAGLAAGLTTVGISGTSAFLGGVGGTALIASTASISGGAIGLKAANRRTGAVQTFEYRPLHNNKKLNLIVTVSGWMTGKVDDVRLPYSTIDPIMGDIYSVLWEPEMLRSMGDTINILATEALTTGLQQVLGNTVLIALMASLQLPLVLTKLAYLIDNPWTVSLTRAQYAGLIMADSLRDRNLGNRPITLIGFSLGARAHGLIQNVYLFGSPIVANKDDYLKARSVVSGRFVNGYSTNDWILGYLFRATSGGIMRVSGLAPVEGIPRLENVDLTKIVNGHMDYRSAMPRILKEVGWEVLEDEFAEIEDPDPDNHAERQRELIREIDEARREAELKPEKKRFGLFKRGKMAEKKSWETYDVNKASSPQEANDPTAAPGSVLFDIEAIRSELASEAIEVKQLESTLPPMKLDLNPPSESTPITPAKEFRPEPPPPPLPPPVHEEEEVSMTFDTSFHDDDFPPRPELKSYASTPANNIGATATGAMALEPNAWADHDEEISMTFE